MELVKDVGGRPQKSPGEQQVKGLKPLDGVLAQQQLAAYFGACESTLIVFLFWRRLVDVPIGYEPRAKQSSVFLKLITNFSYSQKSGETICFHPVLR